jgi:hypothetical protein
VTEPQARSDLPALATAFAARAVSPGEPLPYTVQVGQVGVMRLKPGGRELRFTAVEAFSVAEVAFIWQARFPLLPLLSLHVVDRYAGGEGLLEARLLGIPVMRQRGQATAEGEAIRYLAELPWVPHAIVANHQLDWRELDPATLEVSTLVGTNRVAVRLLFDEAGDIVGSSADRHYTVASPPVPTPWAGVFFDYKNIGGVRVPTRAEVHWELPDGPFTYWRGTVTSLEALR